MRAALRLVADVPHRGHENTARRLLQHGQDGVEQLAGVWFVERFADPCVVATCGAIEFELGWATRSTVELDQLRADRDAGYEWLATHDEDWRRVLDVQASLWRSGRMRPVGLPGLLIAAVAERERVTVLHYDGD